MDNNLKNHFIKLLEATAKTYSGEKGLTALFPIEGNKYKSRRDLMVVGRALNSWGNEHEKMWWSKDKFSKQIGNNIIGYSKEKGGVCSMKWITDHWKKNSEASEKDGYHMNSSAFWRVTKNILKELKVTQSETDWSSYLVWTDLYKVSYNDGGNPSKRLMNTQFKDCVSFLKKEIEYFNPKRILFLTGYDWFEEFENEKAFEKKFIVERKYRGELVEWKGYLGRIKIVVAKHPQGKPEWKYVQQVVKSFSSL